jgi:hypothetical protein
MEIDDTSILRDRHLRYRMLRLLNSARGRDFFLRAHMVRDLVKSLNAGDEFEDDNHVIGLLRDLQNGGYAEIIDRRTRENERLSLSFLDCRITGKGTRFLASGEPPDALIADGRIVNGGQG